MTNDIVINVPTHGMTDSGKAAFKEYLTRQDFSFQESDDGIGVYVDDAQQAFWIGCNAVGISANLYEPKLPIAYKH